jgi:RNA polymerase sigma-70 factor (ECF subfamily)
MMNQSEIVRSLLEHRDLLLGYLCALTRDHAIAEEVFQETSLVILEEAKKVPRIANFPAWAREIARRRAAAYFRNANRREGVEQLSGAMTEIIEQAFNENEMSPSDQQRRMTFLLECIERLAGRSREVVTRFYRDHQNIKAIASALDWQADSVKVALSRARKALADCIHTKMAQESHGQ